MLKREILFKNNFVQITGSGWLAGPGQLTSQCIISHFSFSLTCDLWIPHHYSQNKRSTYLYCFFSLFQFLGILLVNLSHWLGKPNRFCELPRAGFAPLSPLITWFGSWRCELKICTKYEYLSCWIWIIRYNIMMLTKTMVYLGLPLVISVPQLFFPPQVEKFYLGRLSKGRYLLSMKIQA